MNIFFNGTKYQIDESALQLATSGLKSYLSTDMYGSGATIEFDDISYNIDSTKLSTAISTLISHLGTIAGHGSKVVVNGVEYNVDSAKLSDAISELEAVLSGLNGGNTNPGFELPFAWNSLEVMNNPTFKLYSGTELEMEFVKISDAIPSIEQLAASKLTGTYNGTTTVSHIDGAPSVNEQGVLVVSFMTEPDENDHQIWSLMFGFTAPGEYSDNDIAFVVPEAGFYALNDGAYGASVDYVLELDTPSNGSDTLTWDGNIEGLESLFEENGGGYFRVSEVVPTLGDCVNGAKITISNGESFDVPFENIENITNQVGMLNFEFAIVVPYDGFELDGFVIPKAGVYFVRDTDNGEPVYVTSLTIHGYNGFPTTPSNDNIFPINWNTSKVTGNATVEVTGLPLVKVSDKLPSFEQLQQSFMTMSENGITKMSLVSDIAEDSSDAYGGTYLFDGSGDVVAGLVFLFVFTNPGEVYGAYIPEAGIYVMNEGADKDYTLDVLESGLYSSGTLMKTWQELLNENIIHIDNGSVYTNATLSNGNSSSSELSDILILPDDGTITKLGTFNSDTFEGNMAFSSCTELTYIYLPANIKEIGALDFVGCTSLKAIVSLANIETIGYRAFGDCSSFTGGAGELHLNSIISIGQYAFQNCSSLVEVHLGCNLTKISAGAFLNCSNLRSLHFDGTVEQWNNIELGNDWCHGTQITGVICADGSIDFT